MEDKQKKDPICDMCINSCENVKVFSCEHKICNKCLYRILLRSYLKQITTNNTITIDCICKKGKLSMSLDEMNKMLSDLIESSKKEQTEPKKEKYLKCVTHIYKKQFFFCIDCKEDICEDCFLKGGRHFEHKVITTKDYMLSLQNNLSQFPNLNAILSQHEDHINNAYNEYSKKLTENVDSIINELTKYKERILNDVSNKVKLYAPGMKMINLVYKYFNYEMGHLPNDIHELLFLSNTKVILPEMNFHYNQIERDLSDIVRSLSRFKLESLTELKLNQKLSHYRNVQTISNAHDEAISSLCLLDNLRLASGDAKGTVQIWKMTRKGFVAAKKEKKHSNQVNYIINLHNNQFISCAQNEDCIQLWNLSNNDINVKEIKIKEERQKELRIICVTKIQNRSFICFVNDNTFRLFKPQNDTFICSETFIGDNSAIRSIVELTSKNIVASSSNGTFLIFSQDRKLSQIPGHKDGANCLIKMDKSHFASGGEDNKIIIWEEKDKGFIERYTLTGHLFPVKILIYLKDGRIISGGDDSFVKIWVKNNKDTYECYMTLRGHNEGITGIANVEDSTIISASADKEIKMWLGYESLT